MAEPLKNIYNENFIDKFSDVLHNHINGFDKTRFKHAIFYKGWEQLELKERMRHITNVLHSALTCNYSQQVELMKTLIPRLRESGFKNDSLEFIFIPDFIEVYGIDHPGLSLQVIEEITQFVTCEFAIRPFLLNYPKQTIDRMTKWSMADHWAVRRLATEGCRPRLPWAMGIPRLKKNPKEILPILESLKHDPSESVRRSVANNINDISKDHPTIVIEMVRNWQSKEDINMHKLLKHASRGLLKQGHPDILPLFGYNNPKQVDILDFSIKQNRISLGDYLYFTFKLKNNSDQVNKLRLEYKIYYQKAKGTLSPKIYMIQEKDFPSQFIGVIERKQSFKQITTRKFHIGLHKIAIIVNGIEKAILDFHLI